MQNSDFTRNRKLPFPKLIVFVLSIAAGGKSRGTDTKSGEFFRNARSSGLWPDAEAVHRSGVSKARKKVPWRVFRDILGNAVSLTYELWPEYPKYLWHGMSVFAIDGSKYDLPATDDIRQEFDPDSGLGNKGKGHYPQCLVSTLYDVFRRLPVARTVVGTNGSEREEVKNLLPFAPSGSILLFDRGYPSYELLLYLENNHEGHYIFRSPSACTFPAAEAFIESGREEDVILIAPSKKYSEKISPAERKKAEPVKVRIIRLVSPDGTESVLLTNLYDKEEFPGSEITALYFRRREVEGYYRDEKTVAETEKFHSQTVNGILQELFAIMIMSVISRTLMVLSSELSGRGAYEFQFKNAVMTLASEAAVLVPDDPEKAAEIFNEILSEIARVKYYRPKIPRPSQPRVCKKPLNKRGDKKLKRIK
ncbi:MAG: IS4 family transposase [Desulfobacteraceae bacterium]|nr:IS4 family transposase [Desulfobacteraceae bacterium]